MSTSERDLVAKATTALKNAGYILVEHEPRWARERGISADVVAWGPDETGEIKPAVLVEIKFTSDERAIAAGLAQLSGLAGRLDTEHNLLLTKSGWHLANEGFTGTRILAEPPLARIARTRVSDPRVAKDILAAAAWKRASELRSKHSDAPYQALLELLVEASKTSDHQIEVDTHRLTFPSDVFLEAWHAVAVQFNGNSSIEHMTDAKLSRVVAGLASPFGHGLSVFDPFAGHAGLLAAVSALASEQGVHLRIEGFELLHEVAGTARTVLGLMGVESQIRAVDAFAHSWPESDLIISTPPLGLRLSDPVDTPIGQVSDGEVAAVALAAGALKAKGRAVLVTSRGWTFRAGSAVHLREYLATNFRVTALIGLPAIYSGTKVPLLLTIIDNVEPGKTLVGDLELDWEQVLSRGGAVFDQLQTPDVKAELQ